MSRYLWQNRRGTYYFRVRIARQRQCHFDNKPELRKSLLTSDRKTAKRLARAMIAQLDRVLEQLDEVGKRPRKNSQFGYQVVLTSKQHPSGLIEQSKALDISPEEHALLGDSAVAAILRGMSLDQLDTDKPQPPSTVATGCPKTSERHYWG